LPHSDKTPECSKRIAGRRDWFRTNDPHDVNVVLYH
jgi:hypothetical protein